MSFHFQFDIEKRLNEIKEEFELQKSRNDRLANENKRLRDEHYKDEELQKMQKELYVLHEEYRRGFPISEKEMESIHAWKQKHDEEVHGYKTAEQRLNAGGAVGGRYSYIFTPTSIGTSGVIRCLCGAEFEFQEIG